MKYAVGVDIGGTKVAVATVNSMGEILDRIIIPTDLSVAPGEMIDRIILTIRCSIRNAGIDEQALIGIGVGAPGPIDTKKGTITNPPYLTGWTDIQVVGQIQSAFPVPVHFENDASAAALAEKWIGAAKGNDNFTYITISTGIGSGIVVDGRLLKGARGNAGEIGHNVVDPSFGQCVCGQYGCLESIASGTSIAKQGSAIIGRDLTTEDVFEFYRNGHPEINAYIERVFTALGIACVSVINTFDAEKIVLGGGVSKVGAPLFEAIRNYVGKYALDPEGRKAAIVPAELNQDEGVIGAAALCFSELQVPSAAR